MTQLDDLIARARALDVRPDHAREFVGELGRWGDRVPRRTWVPWLAGGFAVAAAAVVALVLWMRGGAPAAVAVQPIALGDRVAIVAEPGAAYRVAVADRETTAIEIDRGTVTARLWPGEAAHRLELRGAGVIAAATGTIYSLTVDDRGAVVSVHEGSVAVDRGGERYAVAAGTRWPADRDAAGATAARVLAAAPLPRDEVAVVDASPPPSDAALADPVAIVDAPRAILRDAAPIIDAPVAALRDRWRLARLLRGQGKLAEAVAECIAIADARDATWSPIAILEAVRIELGPRAAPERAIELVDRIEREWPAHELVPEARQLRCRALRQLGKPCP